MNSDVREGEAALLSAYKKATLIETHCAYFQFSIRNKIRQTDTEDNRGTEETVASCLGQLSAEFLHVRCGV